MQIQNYKEKEIMKIFVFFLLVFCALQSVSFASDSDNIHCKKLKKNYKLCEIKTNINDEDIDHIIEKVIFKCNSKEFRILSVSGFDKAGKLTYSDVEPFTSKDALKKNILYPVIKNSLGETWYNIVCSKK